MWDSQYAENTIHDILDKTQKSLTDRLWLPHPNEDSTACVNKNFYFGATGTLWALDYFETKKGHKLNFSKEELISKIQKMYLEEPDTDKVSSSYFVGQSGINLLAYKLCPNEEIENTLYDLVEGNIENPCVDALWGCPGTMLVALLLHEYTGADRWKKLFQKNVEHLFHVWKYNDDSGAWYWEFKNNGKMVPFIGSGHGFFGNVFPLLKGIQLLTPDQQEMLLTRTLAMTKMFAAEDNSTANWPATFFGKNGTDIFMMQWCHGAPGMIQSLEPIPKKHDQHLEELFLKAGEAIWQAGPLRKGIGICHGTDGNGIALLKLYQRTNDEKWLKRARKLAMHSIETRNGRHTLWTGELGLACFLQGCLDEKGFFPGLDFF